MKFSIDKRSFLPVLFSLLLPITSSAETASDNSPPDSNRKSRTAGSESSYRTIDGTQNNLQKPNLGSINTPLLRAYKSSYLDEGDTMTGGDRPNPRDISNAVFNQEELSIPNKMNASDLFWLWGQFLDHDLSLTPEADPHESANIPVPNDPIFDPEHTETAYLTFNRSEYADLDLEEDGSSFQREQTNSITSWIDASNVYGSNDRRAKALREGHGSGLLKTSAGNLLPRNTNMLPNAGSSTDTRYFLAGDVRANEQVGLIAIHTLFVREHNYQVTQCRSSHPAGSIERDEELYQCARRMVIAIIQHITYDEFLPLLLGEQMLPAYSGYDSSADASISNSFATASYRFGHSAVSDTFQIMAKENDSFTTSNVTLKKVFFCPTCLTDHGGVDPVLRGFAFQAHQKIDGKVVDSLRNALFNDDTHEGTDLVSLNIQRGRDHGLPTYNNAREAVGLNKVKSFSEISSDPNVVRDLQNAYSSVDLVDLWVGGIAEDHVKRSMVGITNAKIIRDQFDRLRKGDRFWYQNPQAPNPFTEEELRTVQSTSLATVIKRNTGIGSEMSDHAMFTSFLPTETSTTDSPSSSLATVASLVVLIPLTILTVFNSL